MSLQLLPSSLKRRLLALRPAPPRDTRAALDIATSALYRLAEPTFAGADALDYARRIVTHPSHVLREHAVARLRRQRDALTRAYHAADAALGSAITVLEEANRETAS